MSFKKIMKRDYASSYRSSTVSATAIAAAAATATMSPTTITTGTSTTLTAGESSMDPESLFIKDRQCIEGGQHKETYVNMLYTNSIPSCSNSDYPYNRNALPIDASHVPPGIIESPEEDDDEEITNKTRKQRRGIFKLKPLNLMKSGNYKLKQLSPPLPQNQTPETPCAGGAEEKLNAALNHPQHAHDHNKTTKSKFRGISCSSSKTIENRNNSDAAEDCDDAEIGMKTAETQTELIECSSPSPISFQLQDEQVLPSACQQHQQQTDNNNEHCRLDINTLSNHRDIKNIDDEDAASGRRIIFSQDNTETNL
ncbi:unnamed protein product [Diamesa serratosioi]